MTKFAFMSIIALGASVLLSCNKEGKIINPNQAINNSNSGFVTLSGTDSNWAQASNSLNPDDSIGYLHNLGLQYILNNVAFGNLNDSTSYSTGIGFCAIKFGKDKASSLSLVYNLSDLESIVNGYNNYNYNFSQVIQNEANIDSTVKTHLLSLIVNITDSNYAYINNYDSLKSKIVNWENGIISSNISSTDKDVLLSSSSILRYSLLAWWNVQFPSNDSGYVTLGLFRKIVGVVLVAASDAVAGSVGAAIGGPAGAAVVGASASAAAVVILKEKKYFK